MSVFNYKSRTDPLEGLRSRVSKIEKLLKRLIFWEVNDIALGNDVLKRRKVTPSLVVGTVSRGPWFKVDMGTGGDEITDWSDWEFGFKKPTTNTVAVNAGELQDSLLNVKAVSAASITIDPSGTTYVFVEYTYGGAVSIKGSTSRPVMDATTYRRILHKWTLVDDVATLSSISHIGNICIPGTFASEA